MGAERFDTLDDAALVLASRNGDTAPFECLVRRHQHRLLNTAYRITGVYEDACDIVQDAFVAAWSKLAEFRGEAGFSTWMTAIVINLSRSRLKRMNLEEHRNAYSLDDPIENFEGEQRRELPGDGLSVLQQLEEAELRRVLQKCVGKLTPEFREVLVLRDMQDMAYDQIAAALSLREGTVKSRLFRARDTVKDCVRKTVSSL
ncbi:MAG: sigma-70 family RNA polymerase sigma factor [Desulfuromonadales bacterium]